MIFENEDAYLEFIHLWIHDIDTFVMWSLEEQNEDLKKLYIRVYKRLILDFRRSLRAIQLIYMEDKDQAIFTEGKV